MDEGLNCPTCGAESPAFRAMSDAVLAVTAELSVGPILQKIVDAARQLVQARYAALGVPDGEGGFARFVVAGITEKQFDAIGELPRTHGLLGAMLEDPAPFRVPDITEDPRFEGWPPAHPNMRSFLGVPIVSKGEIIGAFYLTDKKGGRRAVFSDLDQQLIQTLAAHAAIAIENARLYERSRELSIVEERNRLARELHDAVNQTLFSIALTADASALLVDEEPGRASEQMKTVRQLARDAMEEMRSLIFELRPAELGADGLVPTLRKHVEVLRRVHGTEIELDVEGERQLEAALEQEVFRIAQEALTNALKHARAGRLEVRMDFPDQRLRLCVSDDGAGFDPDGPSARGKLGLVSMRERAQALGGDLHVESRPGAGTTLRLEVELD
jgi:signal transduction histidine kinase